LYKQTANLLLEPRVDDFLRRNHLPSMNEDELTPVDRSSAELYLKQVAGENCTWLLTPTVARSLLIAGSHTTLSD
jgi:hypothetical protein